MKNRSFKIIKTGVLGGASLGLFVLAGVHAQDAVRAYYLNDPVGRNVVTIQSLAPMETIVTTTSDIKAELAIDPSNVLHNPRAHFEINMDSLNTGIALRNEHLKSPMWLDAKQFPKATFTLTRVVAPTGVVPLQQGKTAQGEVEGDLTVHGVTKTVRAQLSINTIAGTDATSKRLKGDILHIRATFPLKLADFNINVPAMAQAEVAPIQSITVDAFSSTGSDNPNLGAGATNAQVLDNKGNVTKMADGLVIEDVKVGDGAEATDGKKVTVHYRGTLDNGKQFDASYDRGEPFSFNLGAGEVIQGWDQGVKGMKVGGKRNLTIPAALGYGARGAGGVIPPNSTLHFEVELLKVS